MTTMNIMAGAELATTITITIDGEKFTTLRSLHEITESEMTDYVKNIFAGCFTNHLGESEPVLGNGRIVELENGVRIETEVDWVDGIVNFHMMHEIEAAIKKARKAAAIIAA